MWNGKWSVWCGWESMAGLGFAGAQLEEVCRDGVFLVDSGQEQSRTWVLHSPSGREGSEPVAQERERVGVGGCSFIQIQLTELLYIP